MAFLTSAMGVLFSLCLHLKASSSSLQFNLDVWTRSFSLHRDHYPYNIRPFQNFFTELLHQISGWTLKNSFFVIQFLLVFISSLLFYRYLRKMNLERNWSLVGLSLFLLSFPIAAAHFEPVHTWDDFWMYGFSILTFSCLVERRWLLASVFFILGCFAREQMLLFYPLYLFEIWSSRQEAGVRPAIFCLLWPILIYGSFYAVTYQPSDPKRWSLIAYNFATPARAADSTISIWNAFGFLWLPATVSAIKTWRGFQDKSHRICLIGATYAVPITLIFGVFFTLVRETRILFPPFIFVIPLALLAIREDWLMLSNYRSLRFWIIAVVAAAVLIFIGIQLANLLWPEFDYGSSAKIRRIFAGVNFGLAMLYFIFLIKRAFRRK